MKTRSSNAEHATQAGTEQPVPRRSDSCTCVGEISRRRVDTAAPSPRRTTATAALGPCCYACRCGDIPAGAYFMQDSIPRELWPDVDNMYLAFRTRHIGRAALILLCIVTELQLRLRVREHRTNERIVEMWSALMGGFEAKEIYNERYKQLMEDEGIAAKA